MFDRMVVYEALKRSLTQDYYWEGTPDIRAGEHDSLISLLIHDIFGGEILKTRKKKGWHFYNLVDGKRIDFTSPEIVKSIEDNHFEDIPSTPDETYSYFENEEYSTFLMRFIRAFEEAVGLDKYCPGLTT